MRKLINLQILRHQSFLARQILITTIIWVFLYLKINV